MTGGVPALLALVAPAAQDTPAVEWEAGWDTTTWLIWWGFVLLATVLAVFGPAWASDGGPWIWGLGAIASYIFLFTVAYPTMARHTPGEVAGWIFGIFLVLALLSWGSLAWNWDSGGWFTHVIGGLAPVSVVLNGIGEAVTRNAAQANMSTGGYVGGILGIAALIAIFIFSKRD